MGRVSSLPRAPQSAPDRRCAAVERPKHRRGALNAAVGCGQADRSQPLRTAPRGSRAQRADDRARPADRPRACCRARHAGHGGGARLPRRAVPPVLRCVLGRHVCGSRHRIPRGCALVRITSRHMHTRHAPQQAPNRQLVRVICSCCKSSAPWTPAGLRRQPCSPSPPLPRTHPWTRAHPCPAPPDRRPPAAGVLA